MDVVVVKGESMSSCFKQGDILALKKLPIDEIKPGNVVVFQLPEQNKLCFHRVIKILNKDGKKSFLTKGDKISIPDPEIQFEWIKGVVTGKIRAGKVKKFTRFSEIYQLKKSVSFKQLRPILNIYKLRIIKALNFLGVLFLPLINLNLIPLQKMSKEHEFRLIFKHLARFWFKHKKFKDFDG